MDKRAKILISINEGRFEIEGEQDFVEKQLESFKDHIEKALDRMASGAKVVPAAAGSKQDPANPNGANGGEIGKGGMGEGLAGYENIYAQVDDKIQILKPLPGTTKAEKAVSAALLIAHAYRLLGIDSVSFTVIRAICTAHGCLDSSNFSYAMKGEKEHIVVTGKPGSQAITLTVPGRTRAANLAASLNVPSVDTP